MSFCENNLYVRYAEWQDRLTLTISGRIRAVRLYFSIEPICKAYARLVIARRQWHAMEAGIEPDLIDRFEERRRVANRLIRIIRGTAARGSSALFALRGIEALFVFAREGQG